MKTLFPQRKTSGFTLIELLTVIAIIAVLMGLLFPAVGAVKDSARKAQAKTDLMNIVNAIKAYYTEYGRYPVGSQPPAGNDNSDYATDQKSDSVDLFNTLRVPYPATPPARNPRGIVFIEVPAVKDPNNPRAGINDGAFYDPWGSGYMIKIDNNYNGLTKNEYDDNTGAGFGSINTGVIAWSAGKDKKQPRAGTGGNWVKSGGTKNFKDSDDAISWQ
jgi:prepilin-type N-terminal cleavage/methylation domain-containing protein